MTLTAMRRPKLVLAAMGVRRVKTAVTRMPSPSTHLPPYSSARRPPGYLVKSSALPFNTLTFVRFSLLIVQFEL